MDLRERVVDDVLRPLPLAVGTLRLLEPVQPESVPHAPDHIGQLVAIDVAAMDEDPRCAQLEFGVKGPRVGAISGLFAPAAGGDNVDSAIAVDVADADAVPCPFIAEVVLLPGDLRLLLSQLIPDDHISGIGQEVELTVPVDVDQFAGLHVAGSVDFMLGPRLGRIAPRVLDPADPLAEVIARHDIRTPIAVHVERRVRKVLVVVRVRGRGGNFTNFVRRPLRGLVPGITGEDVDLAIAVEVGCPSGFVGRLVVHVVLLPADRLVVSRQAGGPQSSQTPQRDGE